jgi:hypothetical protein
MDSLAAGDALVGYVYNSIKNSSLWQNSLLIITYDEHADFTTTSRRRRRPHRATRLFRA